MSRRALVGPLPGARLPAPPLATAWVGSMPGRPARSLARMAVAPARVALAPAALPLVALARKAAASGTLALKTAARSAGPATAAAHGTPAHLTSMLVGAARAASVRVAGVACSLSGLPHGARLPRIASRTAWPVAGLPLARRHGA